MRLLPGSPCSLTSGGHALTLAAERLPKRCVVLATGAGLFASSAASYMT